MSGFSRTRVMSNSVDIDQTDHSCLWVPSTICYSFGRVNFVFKWTVDFFLSVTLINTGKKKTIPNIDTFNSQ